MSKKYKFKEQLIKYEKAVNQFRKDLNNFELDIKIFMNEKGIPVSVWFFGDTFGIDIKVNINYYHNVPRKLSLDVISDFCEEFGCTFEYTVSKNRWIFSFDGLNMSVRL